MISLDPLRPYADLIRWVLALALAAGLVLAGYRWGASYWRGEYTQAMQAAATAKAGHAAELKRLADATAAVAEKVKAASEALAESRVAADTRYQEALNDAKRAERDLAAALRRGDVQLQPQWTCDSPGSSAGGAAGDAGQAGATGRYDSAARIAAAADADAAVIDWLWAGWQADRRAVIAAGCAVEAR